MPGIPLVTRVTVCNYSTCIDHMCRNDHRERMSLEEQIAAEESLSAYCKPVELYNVLQHRAMGNPSFLQRCLRYKLEAKHKKRIQMSISLPSALNNESDIQSLFPLCVLLARQVDTQVMENSAVYCFSRESILTDCVGLEWKKQNRAKFILPDIEKLSAEVNSGCLSILFVSCANLFKEDFESSFSANATGPCLLGEIPLEVVQLSWENSSNLSAGDRENMLFSVDLHSCHLEASFFGGNKYFKFQKSNNGVMAKPLKFQVNIVAQELGAKERSPYHSFSYSGIPSSILPQTIRLRTGNVVFNYRYHNDKLQRTEVTEDFTCPFCLVKCASFKGLKLHLPASHDLFNFEFWVTEEFQAVNVSLRSDIWRSEIAAGVDPKEQTFSFCSKSLRHRKRKRISKRSNHALPLVIESDLPGSTNVIQEKTDENGGRDASSPRISSATANLYADPECPLPVTESSIPPVRIPSVLQPSTKSRKLSTEREPKDRTLLLKKREFFHSHRAQPMAMEQVLSDRDSEDEVDDDVADLEDRRMLDDFVDVTKDEKSMMHLWNSFVRKQRVLADAHVPWACEAFSKLHGQDLVKNPALLWCWRLFLVKLWNHSLLDPRTMNSCNIILDGFQMQDADP